MRIRVYDDGAGLLVPYALAFTAARRRYSVSVQVPPGSLAPVGGRLAAGEERRWSHVMVAAGDVAAPSGPGELVLLVNPQNGDRPGPATAELGPSRGDGSPTIIVGYHGRITTDCWVSLTDCRGGEVRLRWTDAALLADLADRQYPAPHRCFHQGTLDLALDHLLSLS